MTSCTFLYTFGPLVWFNLGPSAVPLPSQAMGRGPREQRKSCSCKRLSRRADPCSMGRDHLPGTRATVAPPPRQLLSALPRPPQGPPRRTAPAPGWWPRQGLLASEVWPSLCSSELAFHGSKRNSTQVYTERRTDLDNRVLRSSGFSHCCLPASAVRFSALPLWKGCPPYHRVTYFKRKTHYPRGRRTLSLPQTASWYGWPLNRTPGLGAPASAQWQIHV